MNCTIRLTLLSLLYILPLLAEAEEPALPAGLGGAEPSLPSGLGTSDSEPSLPSGLGSDTPSLPLGLGDTSKETIQREEQTSQWRDALPFDLTGFAETRYGKRVRSDATQKQTSIGEGRLHLEATKSWDAATATLVTDFLYDPVADRYTPDLENGEGWLDVREANLLFRPTDNSDVKIGRQILTWGTGDLVFINDLFPKDWNSFFIGRDEEYLKAPSDAIKTAFYHELANLDIIYTPRFDSDRFIDGSRISYFNSNSNAVVGRSTPAFVDERGNWFSEDELALRLHRLIGTYETALYYYHGYWKSPGGQDAGTGLFTFPRLSVYGASLRGPLGAGIINAETGYYDSRDDDRGTNSLINNSEWRFLVGYEQELWPEMTAGIQYYQEWLQDYDGYFANVPTGTPIRDEHRHMVTLRLTQLLMNQNLALSLFNFYSPSDEDGYLRPNASYKLDDHWTASIGSNWFYGNQNSTFFGQFEDNSNIYASLRYGF